MESCNCIVMNMCEKNVCWKALNKVGLIGVPFNKGQTKYGVDTAPAVMRSSGLIEELSGIDGLDIKDYGDIHTNCNDEEYHVDNMANLAMVSACTKNVCEQVAKVIKDDRVAVTIGGDHSIAVGTIHGHCSVHEDVIVVWVDAHADINTYKTSESGSIHGMPLAIVVKELCCYWPHLPPMDWLKPIFSIKSLGYIGLRSVDPYETLLIKKYNIPAYAMPDIDEHGVKFAINQVLKTLDPTGCKPIHVSFDIDAIDSIEAPSTGTAVRGGLTLREAICLMETIHNTGRLRAMDLVEINPAIGSESDRRNTLNAGFSVLKAALGFSRRGTAPRGVLDIPTPDAFSLENTYN